MKYNYTVHKKKSNRYAYRFLGIIFIAVIALQLVPLLKGYSRHPMLTCFFCVIVGFYGIYLIKASFRKQAFDITYTFSEEGLTVKHHYGTSHYNFDDIDFITMIIPDESMIFYMLNIKAGKDKYAIPFTMQKELCEEIYEFVNSRIKHDNV